MGVDDSHREASPVLPGCHPLLPELVLVIENILNRQLESAGAETLGDAEVQSPSRELFFVIYARFPDRADSLPKLIRQERDREPMLLGVIEEAHVEDIFRLSLEGALVVGLEGAGTGREAHLGLHVSKVRYDAEVLQL